MQSKTKISYNIINENVVTTAWSFEMKKINLDLIASIFFFIFLVLGAVQWFVMIKEADKEREKIYECQVIINDYSQEGWNYCKSNLQ